MHRHCRKDEKIRTVLLFHGMKPRMLQRATHTSNSRVQQLVHSKQNFTIYQVRPHFNGVLKKGNKLKLNIVKM